MNSPILITNASRETNHMVRTRNFRATEVDLPAVLEELQRERFTGKITISVSSGTPVAIEAEQRTRVSAV
jgi:hypothetical protein